VADLYVLCGDCAHCDPEFYDGDDECGPECHPRRECQDRLRARVAAERRAETEETP
jgi:hypothetical protein